MNLEILAQAFIESAAYSLIRNVKHHNFNKEEIIIILQKELKFSELEAKHIMQSYFDNTFK